MEITWRRIGLRECWWVSRLAVVSSGKLLMATSGEIREKAAISPCSFCVWCVLGPFLAVRSDTSPFKSLLLGREEVLLL